MEGQRITLDPTAHTSFAERLAAAERARAGRGAAPDDEGERKGATTLFLYGALLVACAAVAPDRADLVTDCIEPYPRSAPAVRGNTPVSA